MADEKTFTKTELDDAIAKVTADFETRIEAIDARKAEALDEAKKAKAALRKVSEINPEDVAAIEAERDKALADLAAAQKTAKDATTAAEKAAKALEAESGFTHKLLAENGVVAALTAAGVTDPTYLDVAKAFHLPNVKVIAEGDARKAMYGDKPLEDAIKEWAASDAGKKLVAAPVNGGGAAPGSKIAEAGKTTTRDAFEAMDQGSRAAFAKEGGKVVDAAS